MIFAMMAAVIGQLGPVDAAAEPRHWPIEDRRVQFEVSPMPGTRALNLPRNGANRSLQGPYFLEMTCEVAEAGRLENCRILHDEPRRVFNHRVILRAAHAGRLRLGEDGPRVGDTVGWTLQGAGARVRAEDLRRH